MNTKWNELIQRYISGTITDAEAQLLERQLKSDPALRDSYLDALNLDSALEATAEAAQSVLPLPLPLSQHALASASISALTSLTKWRFWAAAVVALCGLLFWQTRERNECIAEMIEVQRAQWDSSTLPTEPGSRLGIGRLRLVEGLARLRFARGAEVTLEGPADLELLGEQVCRLRRGSLVAHVPAPARGFSVQTPSATLIDHGTDFGLSTDNFGHASVQVIQGEVELRHVNGAPPLRLTTSEMASITPEKLFPAMPLEAEPRRQLLQVNEESFTSEITTRSGDGAAAYISQARVGSNQSNNLLLLKSCAEEGYGRKVLLRFDLRLLPSGRTFREYRLVLHMSPTGYGYSSRSGDARIGVYALTAHEQDDWNPSSVNWENQPARDDDASKVDMSKTVRVAEFVVPQGVQTGSFSIEGEALNRVMSNNSNRLLTLILVRENAIQAHGGVVLGIAGNNHPLLPPPTLWVR